MKPFIELTLDDASLPYPQEGKIYLNTDNIVSIRCDNLGKTKTRTITGLIYTVKELVEQITKHLSILRVEGD